MQKGQRFFLGFLAQQSAPAARRSIRATYLVPHASELYTYVDFALFFKGMTGILQNIKDIKLNRLALMENLRIHEKIQAKRGKISHRFSGTAVSIGSKAQY